MIRIFLLSLLLSAATLPAAEVYFDTVSTAKASRLQGSYVSAYGGTSSISKTVLNPRYKGFSTRDSSGWAAGVKFGYEFATPLPIRTSAELELGYLNSSVDVFRNSQNFFRGNLQSYHAFGNFVVGLDLDGFAPEGTDELALRIKPYLGVGAGVALTSFQDEVRSINQRTARPENGSKASFGYQVFGGVEVELSEELSLYGEYKYMDLYDLGEGDLRAAALNQFLFGMRLSY
jgi:opacity protein-like surface antigen